VDVLPAEVTPMMVDKGGFKPPKEISLQTLYPYFAPHIIKNELAKTLALVQMFTNPAESELFHILMVGSPACGKGKIMREVSALHPICGYISKKTTIAGLVGKIEEFKVRGGILHEIDGGLLMADEIARMPKQIRDTFLEPMEDGICNISAYGYTTQIKCHINILAACNPQGETWGNRVSVEQIPFGRSKGALLSRFHILLPMRSLGVDDYNSTLANAFYKKFMQPTEKQQEKIDWFHKLIEKRLNDIPFVHITEEQLDTVTLKVKAIKKKFGNRVIISPRTVHGMTGAARGLARLHGRADVSDTDINYSENLFLNSLKEWDRL
jgi:DNA replicative helicase MCM subunit Mcm2 (Cdc46/Mcm family)